MQSEIVVLLETIIKGIVDNHNDVSVVETKDDMGTLLMVNVEKTEVGKVIGREGSTINAIRTIIRCAGSKYHARVSVKVADGVTK